ncbi:MAG TPA: tetratricopeptide repeat protein [Candidatus Udaeobacter sp.]|nr:tetratricopeptide repeat protein [Candidatus Udaeobacter sp.]
MAQKRLTKQEIREDPLVTWALKAETFALSYWKPLVIGIGVVALGLAIGFLTRGARRTAEATASEQLAQAQMQLWTEGEGNSARAIELANRLIEQSPGTRSGRIAYLVKGDALLQQNDAEGALAAYRTYIAKDTGDPVLRRSAERGVAVALENTGKFAEAATAYEGLAAGDPKPSVAVPDLMSAARCRERAWDLAGAGGVYEKIVAQYPGEAQAADAKLRLAEVKVRTAQAKP